MSANFHHRLPMPDAILSGQEKTWKRGQKLATKSIRSRGGSGLNTCELAIFPPTPLRGEDSRSLYPSFSALRGKGY